MELEFINWLTERAVESPHVAVGIGDDAAVLHVPPGGQLVVTTDMLVEAAHFEFGAATAEQIGRKSLAVNLSDLAAMAAAPLAAFVSISLPQSANAVEIARALITGMTPLAEQYGCPIAGGDTNRAPSPLMISVTVIGAVESGAAWLRSGAQPGDRILVTGQLGGSLLGHHLDFAPRVNEALTLRDKYNIHAAMDISDGLALDLSRMTKASGVGAVVDTHHVPIAAAANRMAKRDGRTALEHALSDGEDFELLLAVAPAEAKRLLNEQPLACGLSDVGEFVREPALQQCDENGAITRLAASGYEH